jgi:hypothetical protein
VTAEAEALEVILISPNSIINQTQGLTIWAVGQMEIGLSRCARLKLDGQTQLDLRGLVVGRLGIAEPIAQRQSKGRRKFGRQAEVKLLLAGQQTGASF